ncbi:hypothetical protein PIB30_040183 [Stylosanthes scabra]|uniref:Uncharacterized protein n=1 Tax=Stylosanthes scabra TaxID=79078 RepID=A0ABU6YD91_9FABA|nr:hypothetical protein [Stylosanthes scabra]
MSQKEDRSTNHIVRGMESQGEVPIPEEGVLPQNHQAEMFLQQNQQPDISKDAPVREVQKSNNSFSVNQQKAPTEKGKAKMQVNNEGSSKLKEQEESTNKQAPIKELLKQAFKNKLQNLVNQAFLELWSYREKPRMMKTLDKKRRKKIQRQPPTVPYTVEFPEEDRVMQDSDSGYQVEDVQDEELAWKINNSLHLKRKREDVGQPQTEDGIEESPNINKMQVMLKRHKEDTAEDMAEEAGPSMPPPKT